MIEKTVFVIGAGASKEAGLPTGEELKGKIAGLLNINLDYGKQRDGDDIIVAALEKHANTTRDMRHITLSPYLDAVRSIRASMPLAHSIDDYLDKHRTDKDIALCGKLAIVRAILKEEQASKLYPKIPIAGNQKTIDFNLLKQTWYSSFFKMLTTNCVVDELADRFKSIALIVFNYDRCVEHFLCLALQTAYRLEEGKAAEIIRNLSIYHPYGSVGSLHWQAQENSEAMKFGADPDAERLLLLCKGIKTFTEGTDPNSSQIAEIKTHMGNAQKLVFVGFAFHPFNMGLIRPIEIKSQYSLPNCFASTYGISPSGQEDVRQTIFNLYNYAGAKDVNMTDKKCCEFFEYFSRNLAL